jgi:hypothetical protein
MNPSLPSAYTTLLACARQVVDADDAHALDQKLIDLLRAACLACERDPSTSERHTTIPTVDGLYWYHRREGMPKPVLIDQSRYPGRFVSFDGSHQRWLAEGEFFTGPVPQPAFI